MTFKTADLSDTHEGGLQIVSPGLLNLGGSKRFHGEIVTIRSLDDNSRVREQIHVAGQGKVLVIDNEASMRCAMLGDMMAAALLENGWSGVVVNGCIRDAAEIAEMDIGVKALATNPLRSVKEGRGEANIEVSFLDANFRPGEFLYSDEDGILLSATRLI
ncbi:MAG: ribonuclease E activity regulator RraA [Gammaproteobacteria bacterium]|nr:ribonuclease E activity regulator RraA [Gammaproteobacteria bacterium]